jgi:very-short-patch-repair endonuclease
MAYLGKSKEREMYFGAKPELFKRAYEMRKNPTEAETILWSCLRSFRSEGLIFRRQHPLDIFIADFYCHQLKLVIEVDGEVHENEEALEYDLGRSAELERYGIKVLRFNNKEVIEDTDSVVSRIRLIISELTAPSLLGEGDKRGRGIR